VHQSRDLVSVSETVIYLVVAIATTRYCSGVEPFPDHIPVVIFVSSRIDSLMFARSSVSSQERNFALHHL